MLLREVEVDRHRFRQHETVIVDRRHAAVRVQRQVFRRAGSRRARRDVDMLVFQAEFLGHPERAGAARAGRTIDAEHAFPPGRCLPRQCAMKRPTAEATRGGPDMTEARPVLAVTMGDPAGIGPEIAVRALLSPEVRECSRSFLIGDARVFEQALAVCGLSASLNRIAGPEAMADQRRRDRRACTRRPPIPTCCRWARCRRSAARRPMPRSAPRSSWRWPGASPAWRPRRSTRSR